MKIEELQTLVSTLQNDIITANAKIFELQTNNGKLLVENGNYKNDNLEATQKIENLTKEKTELEGKIVKSSTKPVKDTDKDGEDEEDDEDNKGFEVAPEIFSNDFIGEF